MRAKIIIPVLGLAVLLITVAALVHFGGSPTSPQTSVVAAASPVSKASVQLPASPRVAAGLSANYSSRSDPYPDTPKNPGSEYSTNRVDQLSYLATTGNADALKIILSELSDADPQIRKAALAGAIEFGNRSAIPALDAALISNPNPQEQVNIQKAIDYLQLPTIEELDYKQAGTPVAAGEAHDN